MALGPVFHEVIQISVMGLWHLTAHGSIAPLTQNQAFPQTSGAAAASTVCFLFPLFSHEMAAPLPASSAYNPFSMQVEGSSQ